MMGFQSDQQPKLFYPSIHLKQRIPAHHALRRIKSRVDFDFIYDEVKDRYGIKGNVSVPPPAILKMMLLLVLYNVRSERELMNTIPLRLDWLWFLGYDLDSEIPNHSVLSKARTRWGVEAFRCFFERIVWQCVQAGLVDGTKLFMDSSLIEADASNNSVFSRPAFEPYLVKGTRELEARLEEPQEASRDEEPPETPKSGVANKRHVSTTDPDASVVRQGKGGASLKYKIHRAVDVGYEVITATEDLMERSFAWSTRYGFKRARWRRLWRVQIQEYLTAAVQNMMILLRHVKERGVACGMALAAATPWAFPGPHHRISCGISLHVSRM